MKKGYVLPLICVLVIVGVQAQTFPVEDEQKNFVVAFTLFSNDTVSMNNVFVGNGSPTTFSDTGEYQISVRNATATLFAGHFSVNFKLPYHTPPPSGEHNKTRVKTAPVMKRYWLPYYSQATEIVLQHGGTEIFTLDIAQRLCNPDSYDDQCPGYCRNKGIDPDCAATAPDDGPDETSPDTGPEPTPGNVSGPTPSPTEDSGLPIWAYILMGVFVILLLFVIFMSVQVDRHGS